MKIVRGVRQFVSNSSVSVRALVVSVRGVSQFVSNSFLYFFFLKFSVATLSRSSSKPKKLYYNKAIPIKCFVSHRPTDPFFGKSKKKKIPESLVKKQVL